MLWMFFRPENCLQLKVCQHILNIAWRYMHDVQLNFMKKYEEILRLLTLQ